jgi:2-polyprenyl-3-methyl-5-hydroxy-6-metoxy-1,4-benzoquinol methylase
MSDLDPQTFYGDFAPFYHLIYPDWEQTIARQARAIDQVVAQRWGAGPREILDAACGIGTQAIGLVRLGHEVTASDIAPAAVDRARGEAASRALSIAFSVCDMRSAHLHHGRTFDLVIAVDNAVPHLLDEQQILVALQQLLACTRPGGGCLISVRDYAALDSSKPRLEPYGVRSTDGRRFVLFQTMFFEGTTYELSMYVVEDDGQSACRTHVMRTRYLMITVDRLIELMREAGFDEVDRIDAWFGQPLIAGTSPGSP